VARKPQVAASPVSQVIQRLLLREFAPCSVVVDENDTIVYVHGRSGLYFEPEQGTPRNNIHEMARQGLREALGRAISQARGEASEVRRRGVRVRTNGESMTVDLTVKALHKPRSLRGLVLVTVEPGPEPADIDGQGEDHPKPESQGAVADREEQLDRELTRTREDLQSTVEELQSSNEEVRSSNEELQSMNEELQSANEELETSKEEMQSLNEELRTVNAELQSKVDALTRANDDMSNLLNNMQVATIFLDTELRVTRFTEQAKELFRLIDSDVGRPLTDLTSSLDYPSLVEDCREVVHDLARKESEVRDRTGRWHMVRIFPYRTADNVISGLVLTVISIERSKRAEADRDDLRRSRDFFEGVVQTVREPLLALDNDQRVIMGNASFHRKFRTHPEEINGKELGRLGDGQWDVPALRELLEDVLAQDTVIRDYRVEHDFPWIGHRIFLVNARKLPDAAERGVMLLMSFQDITQQGDE
jgi:two-component system CheB/CheR fusion protein